MASEQEELLKELKGIVDSLKSVSQYAKDLSSAVAAANRPMQQLNDYAKAINENMENAVKSETESVNQLEAAKIRLMDQKTETESLRAAFIAVQVEQGKVWTEETKAGKARNEALKDTANLWEKIKKGITDAHTADADGRVKEYTFGTKSNTAAQALTGAGNVAGGLSAITSSLSQLLPVAGGLGGLFGMMLYGKVKEAEFNALGQVAAQQFDQVGGFTDAFANRLTGLTRKLSVAGMAAKEDIAKVTGAMVETGLTAKDAETKIHGFTSAAGSDFLALTLSMDKAFEMAAGTTARFGGTLVRDFNMTTKDAANNLMLMAQAAKDSGANVAVFMQQTMEASSALRLMNANQEAVFETQSRVSKSYQTGGLNRQFSGAYAAKGTQELTGAIGGGMNEGVRAIIGQRMFGGDALDALYKLQSPVARGGKELDVSAFIREMGNIMKESGVRGQGAQYKFSESVFGVGTAGADAFMKAITEQEKTGRVSAETQNEISKGLTREADKMSILTRIVETIKDAVANTMVGLLGMVVNGLKILYNATMAMNYAIVDALTPGGDKEANFKYGAHMANIDSGATSAGKSFDMISKGLDEAAGAGGMAFKASGLGGGWGIDTSPYVKEQLAREKKQAEVEAHERALRQTQVEKELAADPEYQGNQKMVLSNRMNRFKVTIIEQGRDAGNKTHKGHEESK